MRFFFVLVLFFIAQTAVAQTFQQVRIKGQILSMKDSTPIEHASVLLKEKDKLIVGSNSQKGGFFSLKTAPGKYTFGIYFVGHDPYGQSGFTVDGRDSVIDIGIIWLKYNPKILDEVVVRGEKSYMEMALDKKIFNVGKDLANAGGSAAEILMNIPSVSVDLEGNVRLRGSDNVRILIDGKPSGLVSIRGAAGLRNLQASMIEKVELITNPSARYEAEGMAGIINIVLKKDRRQGFNGSFELITGDPVNYGVAANMNYRKKNINFFVNYGLAYRIQPYKGNLYQEVYGKDTTFLLKQSTTGKLLGFNNNIRAGLDYFFSEKSVLTAAYLYRKSKGSRQTNIRYDEYVKTLSNLTGYSKRTQDEDEVEPNSEVSLNYKKTFEQKGHELTAEVKFLDYWENSDQTFTQAFFTPGGSEIKPRYLLQRSLNDEFEKQWLFQLDYVKPFGKEGKLETGLRSSFRNMVNDYLVTQQNTSGGFDPLPGLDNVFVYDENIHAAYGIVGNKSNRISYQAGVRAEWTDVTTTLERTKETNPRDYINLFPSAHVTFDLLKENGLQLSYSRRVRRPFYNDLSPYATFSDSRNFNAGNPDLDPEFSDVIELGHLKNFSKGSISSSVYYRSTAGKIERIRTVDNLGDATIRPQNLLSERAYGIEFTSGYKPFSWWKADINFNFFNARIDGSNILPLYKTETYSWFARQTSRFSLVKGLDMQLRMNYEAAQKTVQGRRKAMFYTDFSISKDIMGERGTINLNILDAFNTRRARSVFYGPNFYYDGFGRFNLRQVNLTFSYRIRQSKNTKNVQIIKAD